MYFRKQITGILSIMLAFSTMFSNVTTLHAEEAEPEETAVTETVEELSEGGRLYSFREGTYTVVTRLYDLCNIGTDYCIFLRNKEQVKFISKIVRDLYQVFFNTNFCFLS